MRMASVVSAGSLATRLEAIMARTVTLLLAFVSTTVAQDYYQTPRIGSQRLASCYNNDGVPQVSLALLKLKILRAKA